jgi:hypothetical protein
MSNPSGISKDRRSFWRALLDEHRAGSLSVIAFCQHKGVTEAAFYYWRKKLSVLETPPAFIRVAAAPSAGLELALASGHVLRIPSGVDGRRLVGVLTALREAQLC